MPRKILEVEGISKKFKLSGSSKNQKDSPAFVYALKNICFDLGEGESLGIIGKNGSGKSTLLKILSGVLKPDSGLVKIYGSFASILDLGFGMVPEFTGRENIFLIGSLSGYTKTKMLGLLDEIIAFAELEEFIDQPVKTYSNGMYLRLAFAVKTIIGADLLILDEVMAVGDIRFQAKCRNKIQELHNNGTSIIIVTHSLKEVADYTKTAFILEKGEMISFGNTMDVINRYETLSGTSALKSDPAINYAADTYNCVRVLDYSLSAHEISMDEKISFEISFEIKIEGNYDVMIYISDFNSVVLSDSFSYRLDPIYTIRKKGIYHCNCHLPPDFFNVGTFYVGYIISNGEVSVYENMRCLSFKVNVFENASVSNWSVFDKRYPLKPKLLWELNSQQT